MEASPFVWEKKWKEYVKLLCGFNGFSTESSAVPNERVDGKRGRGAARTRGMSIDPVYRVS